MRIPVDEQETVIQFDRTGTVAHIDTTDTTVMTKLDKLVSKSDKWSVVKEHYSQEDHELIGKEYITNKSLVSFRADKVKREMTEEQRLSAAERMKQLHIVKGTQDTI